MIKYLGSKRTLIPWILDAIQPLGARSVADVFSGTSRVGHALKALGYQVFSNDHNAYAATLATCYVQADAEDHLADATRLVAEFNALPGRAGFVTETYCERSRFFQPRNGERIDAIREAIAAKGLEPELEAIMLTALIEAADRVDSTTGLQMAYLKAWAPRSFRDLELRVPALLPRATAGKGRVHDLDAEQFAERVEAEVAYIDPPYNQHKYIGNYHIWETIVRWDRPEVYGVACKRVDCRTRRSAFNARRQALAALERVVRALRAKYLVISFSDEGHVSREEMEVLLGAHGTVTILERDFKRYVGAQIGIHNPRGARVGTVSHLRNREYLYLVRR
jgi:adenine-specific DNA-methyltransferase